MSTEDDDVLVCESCGFVISDEQDPEEFDWFYSFGHWYCPDCHHRNGE